MCGRVLDVDVWLPELQRPYRFDKHGNVAGRHCNHYTGWPDFCGRRKNPANVGNSNERSGAAGCDLGAFRAGNVDQHYDDVGDLHRIHDG
jgi:hypothetical protein